MLLVPSTPMSIDSALGGVGSVTPPNVFTPFGKSATFSHHLATSVTVLYQVAAFQFDVQCMVKSQD